MADPAQQIFDSVAGFVARQLAPIAQRQDIVERRLLEVGARKSAAAPIAQPKPQSWTFAVIRDPATQLISEIIATPIP